MAQRGKFDVKLTLQKLMLIALAVVAFQVEPSSAFCICPALAFCSVVSTTDLVVSGSLIKSCFTVSQPEGSTSTPDSSFFVSEYTLTIDHVYKDSVGFTFPDTPSYLDFTSSGYGFEGCRLDLEVGMEYVVGVDMEADGSFSSDQCSATRAVDNLREEEQEALENGGCSFTGSTSYSFERTP